MGGSVRKFGAMIYAEINGVIKKLDNQLPLEAWGVTDIKLWEASSSAPDPLQSVLNAQPYLVVLPEINALNAQIEALQAVDYQLQASNALTSFPVVLELKRGNCYNGDTKVTSGAITRIATNYRTLTASGVTLDGSGFNLGITGKIDLNATSRIDIGTRNFSISGWYHFGTKFENAADLAYIGDATNYFRIRLIANTPRWINSGYEMISYNAIANNWNFLELTRVGTVINFYVNGVLSTTANRTLQNLSSYPVFLGYNTQSGQGSYNNWRVHVGGTITPITTPPPRE